MANNKIEEKGSHTPALIRYTFYFDAVLMLFFISTCVSGIPGCVSRLIIDIAAYTGKKLSVDICLLININFINAAFAEPSLIIFYYLNYTTFRHRIKWI